ncbi:MAG TPA: transcription antitermination factor NusB, partial [Patescibacteria group bacterium]|nr:transcription antitermination factor NusB [Patescibacteria group bacterium]
MANRHLSRSIAMQSLYEWDFNGRKEENIDVIIKKNIKEFGPGMDDSSFVEALVVNTIKNKDKIDPLIEKCAP